MRRTLVVLLGICILASSPGSSAALMWNPVLELSPDKKEELDKAGVDVKYAMIQNVPDNLEYHFVVTVRVPASFSVETRHEIRRGDKLISGASWPSTKGQCTATFVVSRDLLPSSVVRIQKWRTNQHGVRVASGGYTLRPGEFAKHKQYNLLLSPKETKSVPAVPDKAMAGLKSFTSLAGMKRANVRVSALRQYIKSNAWVGLNKQQMEVVLKSHDFRPPFSYGPVYEEWWGTTYDDALCLDLYGVEDLWILFKDGKVAKVGTIYRE